MSLQGSIHKWSDGIGYGAFIPTERAYYNARERRSSPNKRKEYRRNNVTAGIDTHRSDISFGRTNESVRGGTAGHSRAREATKSLTSGEVGGFCWPAERAHDGDVETILASVSSNASLPPAMGPSSARSRRSRQISPISKLSARSVRKYEQAAQEQVVAGGHQQERKQLQRCSSSQSPASVLTSARCRTASSSGGASTQRSVATTTSVSSRSRSNHSSRLSTSRLSSYGANSNDGSRSGRRTQRSVPTAGSKSSDAGSTRQPSSCRSVARERRLRPLSIGQGEPQHRQEEERYQGGDSSSSPALLLPSPSCSKPPTCRGALDPSFDRHHKYDLIAHDRAASGGEITGRFGPVRGSSVVAASLLTSELSTPWSHVLRGQRW